MHEHRNWRRAEGFAELAVGDFVRVVGRGQPMPEGKITILSSLGVTIERADKPLLTLTDGDLHPAYEAIERGAPEAEPAVIWYCRVCRGDAAR